MLNNEDYSFTFVPYFDTFSGICYWSKCWSFRDRVVFYLRNKNKEYKEDECELDIEDIDNIISLIYNDMVDPADWNNPIWNWKEYLNNNAHNLANLIRLREDIKDGFIDTKEIGVIWYDYY